MRVHLAIGNNGLAITLNGRDKTDKGHFTIGTCKLNRHLRKFGWESDYDDAEIAADAQAYLDNPDPAGRMQALQKLKLKLILMR